MRRLIVMNRKNIIIFESKSNMGTPIEYTHQKVTVQHEPTGSEPVFHLRCNERGYVAGDGLKVKSYIGKKYIPLFDAVIRISDLKVLKYKFYAHMKLYLKVCSKDRHLAIQGVNAKEIHDLTTHLKLRVSKRKISTYWDRLLDAWNELNPENKLQGYIEMNEECEGVLECPCMGRFKEDGSECEPYDYEIYVLSHVDDYCPQSARQLYVEYKNRKEGGFGVFIDVRNFKPLKWRFGKTKCGGMISREHYEKIKKILCSHKYGSFYFRMMFDALEKNGYFNAKKFYGLYNSVG